MQITECRLNARQSDMSKKINDATELESVQKLCQLKCLLSHKLSQYSGGPHTEYLAFILTKQNLVF